MINAPFQSLTAETQKRSVDSLDCNPTLSETYYKTFKTKVVLSGPQLTVALNLTHSQPNVDSVD